MLGSAAFGYSGAFSSRPSPECVTFHFSQRVQFCFFFSVCSCDLRLYADQDAGEKKIKVNRCEPNGFHFDSLYSLRSLEVKRDIPGTPVTCRAKSSRCQLSLGCIEWPHDSIVLQRQTEWQRGFWKQPISAVNHEVVDKDSLHPADQPIRSGDSTMIVTPLARINPTVVFCLSLGSFLALGAFVDEVRRQRCPIPCLCVA